MQREIHVLEEAPAYLQAIAAGKRMRSLRAWNAGGIVLLQERLAEVKPLGIPIVVAIGRRRHGRQYSQIWCDDVAIGTLAAETFLGLHLRNFAYCGLAEKTAQAGRLDGL